MALVLQIVFFLAVLLGVIGGFMSVKNWHWSQMLLLVAIVLAATGFSFLAAETLRIHGKLRGGIARFEEGIEREEQRNQRIVKGTDDQPGINALESELRIVTRRRGRVWRGVVPNGPLNDGQIAVAIAQPSPHGLGENSIVYVFETGEPNAAEPQAGAQYLGEFRVVQTDESGAVLGSVQLLDNRTGSRIANSQGPWSLYESMPSDSHDLFTDEAGERLPEEALAAILPAESLEEYVRHGQPATDDDDEWVRQGVDENGQMVGPEDNERAVTFTYRRPLRDYGFLFAQLSEDRVVALAKQAALEEDIAKLEQAIASAERLGKFREAQKVAYAAEVEGTKKEVDAIQGHLSQVEQQLSNAKKLVDRLLALNSRVTRTYVEQQLALAAQIDAVAPAP